MKKLTLILILFFSMILFSTFFASAFFYQRQLSSLAAVIVPDISQDLINSQYLQAERRIEILRRLGFLDLKLTLEDNLLRAKSDCFFHSEHQILVDGVRLGEITDCPNYKTIVNYTLGSNPLKLSIIIFNLFFISAITIPLYRYKKSISKLIRDAQEYGVKYLTSVNSDDPIISDIKNVFKEIYSAKSKIDALEFESEKAQALANQAKQLAHDIRSPLSALNILSRSIEQISFDQKELFSTSVSRINGIANDLLSKKTEAHNLPGITFLPGNQQNDLAKVIGEIIQEKQVEYSGNPNVQLEMDVSSVSDLVTEIDTGDLKRVLSNLINNSVEALARTHGKVTVALREYASSFQILVTDNGRGMSEEILKKVGTNGFSYGKSSNTCGSGLGLYHARKMAESYNGNLRIQSQLNIGSMIILTFPKTFVPKPALQKQIQA